MREVVCYTRHERGGVVYGEGGVGYRIRVVLWCGGSWCIKGAVYHTRDVFELGGWCVVRGRRCIVPWGWCIERGYTIVYYGVGVSYE